MNSPRPSLGTVRGFTLIEVMIATAIIGVLMATFMTLTTNQTKMLKKADYAADLSLVRQYIARNLSCAATFSESTTDHGWVLMDTAKCDTTNDPAGAPVTLRNSNYDYITGEGPPEAGTGALAGSTRLFGEWFVKASCNKGSSANAPKSLVITVAKQAAGAAGTFAKDPVSDAALSFDNDSINPIFGVTPSKGEAGVNTLPLCSRMFQRAGTVANSTITCDPGSALTYLNLRNEDIRDKNNTYSCRPWPRILQTAKQADESWLKACPQNGFMVSGVTFDTNLLAVQAACRDLSIRNPINQYVKGLSTGDGNGSFKTMRQNFGAAESNIGTCSGANNYIHQIGSTGVICHQINDCPLGQGLKGYDAQGNIICGNPVKDLGVCANAQDAVYGMASGAGGTTRLDCRSLWANMPKFFGDAGPGKFVRGYDTTTGTRIAGSLLGLCGLRGFQTGLKPDGSPMCDQMDSTGSPVFPYTTSPLDAAFNAIGTKTCNPAGDASKRDSVLVGIDFSKLSTGGKPVAICRPPLFKGSYYVTWTSTNNPWTNSASCPPNYNWVKMWNYTGTVGHIKVVQLATSGTEVKGWTAYNGHGIFDGYICVNSNPNATVNQ